MAEIRNFKRLLKTFEKLEQKSRRENNGNVNVGYAASYALYVHEDLEAAHGAAFNLKHEDKRVGRRRGKRKKWIGGRKVTRGENQQAKFLEKPFRENLTTMKNTIRSAVKQGVPLIKALLLAGMRLQRESQKIVPVDTGNLKGSAFTEKE